MDHSQLPILVVLIPMLVSFVIPLVGIWNKKLPFYMATAAMAASLLAALGIMNQVLQQGPISYRLGGWAPPWGIEYYIDHLNAFIMTLVCFISVFICIYSRKSITQERPGKEVHFYCVLLLLFTGLIGMLVTGDMFNIYVFLEISSLSAYALIAIGDEKAHFATFKYIIIGTIGACFYLLGVGYLYMATGSLNIHDLSTLLQPLYGSKVIVVSAIFFIIGLGIKMGLFPLHTWLPGAYTHAPSAVSAYIAPLMSKVAAYVFIRVMFTVFDVSFSFENLPIMEILSWIAAVAIIFGSIVAISQSDIKMMLAYSSISQIGYIVLGVTMGNREGFIGSVLHILNHAFMKGCLFAIVGAIIYRHGTRAIERFGNLHRTMPLTSAAFAVAALSMIGLPPTAGFFSKWYLVLGAISAGKWVFVVVIMISSLLNAVYFFRVVEHVFWKPKSGGTDLPIERNEAPNSMLIPILVLAAGILALGFASHWIIEMVIGQTVPAGIL